jgi:hypothetical protein
MSDDISGRCVYLRAESLAEFQVYGGPAFAMALEVGANDHNDIHDGAQQRLQILLVFLDFLFNGLSW